MKPKVMVTGGAGFVGSHLVDALVREGHEVVIYDNLEPQVHRGRKPAYLNKDARFIKADIRDRASLIKALKGVEVVFHQAAAVGVGQSMYEIDRYVDVNARGTGLLMDILVKEKNRVRKVILASSMTCYGEGLHRCVRCRIDDPDPRPMKQLKGHIWDKLCPVCARPMKPVPTPEDKPMRATSLYALTKKEQEEIAILIGQAYDLPVVALRYFNIYGPRKALSNPYVGVVAIFAARLMNNRAPLIFEDGLQSREMVHVDDIVRANILAMKKSAANYQALNVGSGVSYRVADIARILARYLEKDIEPVIVNKFRKGDVRHCFADVNRARELLGFEAKVDFKNGLKDMMLLLGMQRPEDKITKAKSELEKMGLVI